MCDYYEQIASAIKATELYSLTKYSWFGSITPGILPKIEKTLTRQTARNYLAYNLQSRLYSDFYCNGYALPSKENNVSFLSGNSTPHVRRLSAANSGVGFWETGWEIIKIKDNIVQVKKNQLTLIADIHDCLVDENDFIKEGLNISVRFPKEYLGISPGFYMASSNKVMGEDHLDKFVRFYWNLTADGAVRFMEIVTSQLNYSKLPFKLKALNNPNQYKRCDAVVLYTLKCDYKIIVEILMQVYPLVAADLKQMTPAFTKVLAPGIGFAEDPGHGESFGFHRCKILAEGLIQAQEKGRKKFEERMQIVEEHFNAQGIDIHKPFLNTGSDDVSGFQIVSSTQPSRPTSNSEQKSSNGLNSDLLLQTSCRIAERLIKEAMWDGDRCTWLGFTPHDFASPKNLQGPKYTSLGCDFYSGTCGIAMFLSELYSITQDKSLARTAVGAIRQSIYREKEDNNLSPVGFYTGKLGIAFTGIRIGQLLNEEEIFQNSTQLLNSIKPAKRPNEEFDALSGIAGALPALIILQRILNDSSIMNWAILMGERLLESADESDFGYSWKSLGGSNLRNLTGFSHGTAGIGYALIELSQATGISKFREAAHQAFNYERHWFNAKEHNWPDFRKQESQKRRQNRPVSFASSWCHGAPGIALSRIRAFEILKDESCKSEALIALDTTRKVIDTWLNSEVSNFSLCHGLAGNAEVLRYGHQILGKDCNDDIVDSIAKLGIEKYSKYDHSWPCGAFGGQTPNLMLGLAGIGYFYLRLYNNSIPSILILKPEDF